MKVIFKIIFLLLFCCAQVASAEVINLNVRLVPSAVVPPVSSKGGAQFKSQFNTETQIFSWEITYYDLTSPVTSVSFHGPAMVGQNAAAKVKIAVNTQAAALQGQIKLTEQQIMQLMNGKWYCLISTQRFPNGEVRSQIWPNY